MVRDQRSTVAKLASAKCGLGASRGDAGDRLDPSLRAAGRQPLRRDTAGWRRRPRLRRKMRRRLARSRSLEPRSTSHRQRDPGRGCRGGCPAIRPLPRRRTASAAGVERRVNRSLGASRAGRRSSRAGARRRPTLMLARKLEDELPATRHDRPRSGPNRNAPGLAAAHLMTAGPPSRSPGRTA